MLPLVNRAADVAPVAPACCNVCRTCVTTNLVGLVFGGVAAGGLAVVRLARRAVRR
jgi:hypothetical protein